MNAIYGTRANVRKADAYAVMSASRRTPNTISATDKTVHGFKRRIMSQTFSDHGLRNVEERLMARIDDFIAPLADDSQPGSHGTQDGWGSPRNMALMCNWLAFDIISDLSFGEHFNMLKSPELRWFPSVITKASHRMVIVCFLVLDCGSLTDFCYSGHDTTQVLQLQNRSTVHGTSAKRYLKRQRMDSETIGVPGLLGQ